MFQGELERRSQHPDGGVANHEVHPLELFPEALKGFPQTFRIADVRLVSLCAPAEFADSVTDRLGLLVAVMVSHRNVATGFSQFQRDRASDATGSSRHKRYFASKWFGHLS